MTPPDACPGEKPAGRAATPAKKRFDRIYRILRDRICLLDYPPGTRLSEEELAKEFAISRTPVRRVLGRLESEGLVEARHGVGTIVTDVELEDVAQIYHLRMELAVLIGRLSPIPRTRDDLDRIRNLIERCDLAQATGDHRAFLRLNMDFFDELSVMTGNQPLREINERLYYRISRIVLTLMPKLVLAEEFSVFRREMADVLAAAEIEDWDAIGHIRRTHISMSFHRMMQYADRARSRCGS